MAQQVNLVHWQTPGIDWLDGACYAGGVLAIMFPPAWWRTIKFDNSHRTMIHQPSHVVTLDMVARNAVDLRKKYQRVPQCAPPVRRELGT
jgi:hypothetical protein